MHYYSINRVGIKYTLVGSGGGREGTGGVKYILFHILDTIFLNLNKKKNELRLAVEMEGK